MNINNLKKSDGKWNQELYDKLERSGKKYLRELYEGLAHEDPLIREGCAEILGRIGLIESLPILIEHSNDPDWHVRWDIKTSLNMILGAFPSDVISDMIGLSWDKQRHKFKKLLNKFFNEMFPDNSTSTYNKGYELIKAGNIAEGRRLILKGISKNKIDMNTVMKKIWNILKEKGLEPADILVNYYLNSIRNKLPKNTRSYAFSKWRNDTDFVKCPHNSRLSSIIFEEPSKSKNKRRKGMNIKVSLYKGSRAMEIIVTYRDVLSYFFSRDLEGMQLHDFHTDGFWFFDEIKLSDQGNVIHGVYFSDTSRWIIECKDLRVEAKQY